MGLVPNRALQPAGLLPRCLEQTTRQPFRTRLAVEPLGSGNDVRWCKTPCRHVHRMRFFSSVLALIVVVSTQVGCSAIGHTVGNAFDRPERFEYEGGPLEARPGARLTVVVRNGPTVMGVFDGYDTKADSAIIVISRAEGILGSGKTSRIPRANVDAVVVESGKWGNAGFVFGLAIDCVVIPLIAKHYFLAVP